MKNYLIFFISLLFGIAAIVLLIEYFREDYNGELILWSALGFLISLFTGFYLWKQNFFTKNK